MKNLGRIGFGAALFWALAWSFGCIESPSDEAALAAKEKAYGTNSAAPSDDEAMTPEASVLGGKLVYRFSVDVPRGRLDIEPVGLGTDQENHLRGKPIIKLSSAGCDEPGTFPLTCDVTIRNKTPDYYLANLRTWEFASTSQTATLANADFTGSSVVPDSPQSINGSGLCIVEDGSWLLVRTGDHAPMPGFNQAPKGCPTYTYGSKGGRTVPLSILHPDCGQVTMPWTFDTDATVYTFYAALVDIEANHYVNLRASGHNNKPVLWPEDMLSDPRGEFINYSTFVVKPYYLDASNCVGGCKAAYADYACVGKNNAFNAGYHLGAPQCSTPVDYTQPVPTGTFFAVAAGIEYADRLEAQTGRVAPRGLSGAAYCFEYLYTNALLYTWDPTVLEVQTGSTVTPAGTLVDVQPSYWLTSSGATTLGFGNDTAIMARYVNENNRYNLAPVIELIRPNFYYVKKSLPFALFTAQSVPGVVNCRPSVWDDTAAAWTVANTWNTAAAWYGMGTMTANPTCTLAADGVDAAVDAWNGLAYFKVIGASGSGSRIKIENSSDFMQVGLNHSNCTTQGGPVSGSGDIIGMSWCNPCAAGSTNLACGGRVLGGFFSCTGINFNTPNQWVYFSQELTNDAMPGGPSSHKGAGYNAQNAHICVQ